MLHTKVAELKRNKGCLVISIRCCFTGIKTYCCLHRRHQLCRRSFIVSQVRLRLTPRLKERSHQQPRPPVDLCNGSGPVSTRPRTSSLVSSSQELRSGRVVQEVTPPPSRPRVSGQTADSQTELRLNQGKFTAEMTG